MGKGKGNGSENLNERTYRVESSLDSSRYCSSHVAAEPDINHYHRVALMVSSCQLQLQHYHRVALMVSSCQLQLQFFFPGSN